MTDNTHSALRGAFEAVETDIASVQSAVGLIRDAVGDNGDAHGTACLVIRALDSAAANLVRLYEQAKDLLPITEGETA
jgi:hypothetical protein